MHLCNLYDTNYVTPLKCTIPQGTHMHMYNLEAVSTHLTKSKLIIVAYSFNAL